MPEYQSKIDESLKTAKEFVDIEEVLTCINIMANMIINWCGGSIE
ncbi:MAG: hypothetical protein OXR70_03835 [Candidatus Marinimicrobia bacterium]|nr:hypothetical protein [Candidatus Neomarinimicrobiota bacterium]MDD9888085.1 hypothetical protein [Candidatus Neomarinimicrobiota bacterium]MDD9930984.1 hypothetical protein [Candidatus Neomarinimicrobiota bacterium]